MSTDKMSALRAGRPSESRKATTLTSLAHPIHAVEAGLLV